MDWRAPLDRIWTERATLELLRRDPARGDGPTGLIRGSAELPVRDDLRARRRGHLEDPVDGRPGRRRRSPRVWGRSWARSTPDAPGHPALRGTLADTSLFDELRVDPYYRTVARAPSGPGRRASSPDRRHGSARPTSERWSWATSAPRTSWCTAGGLILLDFECAHAGDPAFDLGFFLTHLLLKAIRAIVAGSRRDPRYVGLTPLVLDVLSRSARRSARAAGRAGSSRPTCTRRPAAWLGSTARARSSTSTPRGQALARDRSPAQALSTEPATWDDSCIMFSTTRSAGGTAWQH